VQTEDDHARLVQVTINKQIKLINDPTRQTFCQG